MNRIKKSLKYFNIIIILLIVILFAGCSFSDNEYVTLEDIYNLKTPYIGDNSKISKIFELLDYKDVEKGDMQLITDSKPYGVVKNFYVNDIKYLNESDFIFNSLIFLCIVDNSDYIISNVIDKNDSILTYKLTSESVVEQLGVDFKSKCTTFEDFSDFMEEYVSKVQLEKS